MNPKTHPPEPSSLRHAWRSALHRSSRRVASLFVLLVVLVACGVGASCAAPLSPTLDLAPSSQTLATRATLQLSVTRRFPGGQVDDVTSRVTYASTDRTVATVSERGVVTAGDTPGSVLIKAFDTASDATAVTTLTVVPAAPVEIRSIDVSPSPAKVFARGESQAFTATAQLSNGTTADVTKTVSWSSSNTSVAIVGDTQFDKGFVRAVAPGDTTILATDGATLVQGRSIVFVVAGETAQLEAILVTPDPGTVSLGKTTTFRADGLYADRTRKDITSIVSWSSSRTDLATVDNLGVVTGIALGDVTVTAIGPDTGMGTVRVRGSAAAKVVP